MSHGCSDFTGLVVTSTRANSRTSTTLVSPQKPPLVTGQRVPLFHDDIHPIDNGGRLGRPPPRVPRQAVFRSPVSSAGPACPVRQGAAAGGGDVFSSTRRPAGVVGPTTVRRPIGATRVGRPRVAGPSTVLRRTMTSLDAFLGSVPASGVLFPGRRLAAEIGRSVAPTRGRHAVPLADRCAFPIPLVGSVCSTHFRRLHVGPRHVSTGPSVLIESAGTSCATSPVPFSRAIWTFGRGVGPTPAVRRRTVLLPPARASVVFPGASSSA